MTTIEKIIEFLFGHKYYANIVNTRGTSAIELCSYIFYTKEQAEKHRIGVESTISFCFIETVSFRSRKDYR